MYPENFLIGKYNYIPYELPKDRKHFFPMIESEQSHIEFINKYFHINKFKNKVITISIRDYPYIKSRNSNLKAWLKFALKYKYEYDFIFITDNSNLKKYSHIEKEGFKILNNISWSIPLRAALYKCSFLNMSVGSGPIHLSLFQEGCKTLMFIKNHKILEKKGYIQNISDYYQMKIGENRSFLEQDSKYIWKNDTFKNIDNEFSIFLSNTRNK